MENFSSLFDVTLMKYALYSLKIESYKLYNNYSLNLVLALLCLPHQPLRFLKQCDTLGEVVVRFETQQSI